MTQGGLARAEYLRRLNAEDRTRPARFRLLDREWVLYDGVFSPALTPVTELFTSWLAYPVGGSFLEMGCGAGVTAVVAALSGCRAVTAVDISQSAVDNTRANADAHGVSDRVRVRRGDLFEPLDPGDRFDMIFWNSNFTEAPPDFVNSTDLHQAFFDPAYRAHRAFLLSAPEYLHPTGRLLLGFADIGNTALLRALAAEAGLTVTAVRTQRRALEQSVEFQLLELRPDGRAAWS